MTQPEPDRPQVGRVYDYVLGGHHNFAIDRQTAARIMEVLPAYPKWARLNRRFLQWVADQWHAADYACVLDLGSGLPTQGHLHERMRNARILYSDSDPLCVEYGRELIQHFPQVTYMQADLRTPKQVVDAASAFFATQRHVAVGCIGVAYLLNDEQVIDLARQLHVWCAPESVMALTFLQRDDSPDGQVFANELQQRLSQMGITTYYRTPERIGELLAPWRLVAANPLEKWVGQEDSITAEDRVSDIFWMSGALLEH